MKDYISANERMNNLIVNKRRKLKWLRPKCNTNKKALKNKEASDYRYE